MKLFTRVGSQLILLGAGVLAGTFAFLAAPQPDGATLYKQHCALCHGAEGKGFSALKTPDFTDPKWQASHKDQAVLEAIKNGKKGTAMPAFAGKLKPEEIRAVASHLRSLNGKKK